MKLFFFFTSVAEVDPVEISRLRFPHSSYFSNTRLVKYNLELGQNLEIDHCAVLLSPFFGTVIQT